MLGLPAGQLEIKTPPFKLNQRYNVGNQHPEDIHSE
jgi:hypothetical protein